MTPVSGGMVSLASAPQLAMSVFRSGSVRDCVASTTGVPNIAADLLRGAESDYSRRHERSSWAIVVRADAGGAAPLEEHSREATVFAEAHSL
jgi:hypothetical protein